MAPRENRIKEEIFTQFTATAATAGSTLYSNKINGEIKDVIFAGNRAGSVTICQSGLPTFFARSTISGATTQVGYPRALTEASAGSATTYGVPTNYAVNGKMAWNIGSVGSATASTFDITVRYI